MTSIERLSSDAELDAIHAVLQRDGVVIIENLIAASRMQEMLKILEPIFAEKKVGGGDF